jgi:hypothetical protein
MIVVEAPRVVAALVAAVATSPTGEVGAVICAKTWPKPNQPAAMVIVAALAGGFSDFDIFCSEMFDRVDDRAATIRPYGDKALAFCDADLFERVGRHTRVAFGSFKRPINAMVDTRFYPPSAEQDPARRAIVLAAAGDVVRLSSGMARKVLTHPYDALASTRFDPAVPNPLADALGRAFDVVMITNTERAKAAQRRGEI